jgi:hypothetical protein
MQMVQPGNSIAFRRFEESTKRPLLAEFRASTLEERLPSHERRERMNSNLHTQEDRLSSSNPAANLSGSGEPAGGEPLLVPAESYNRPPAGGAARCGN